MDPLAEAFSLAKAIPKRRNTADNANDLRDSTTSSKKLRADYCSFCQIEPAAVSVMKALTKDIQSFCLLHYYTTRACRTDPSKTTVVNEDEMKRQIPYIQELFSDAFTELQKEIAIESARSMNEMLKNTNDPLSILTDSAKPHRKKKFQSGKVDDGGFIKPVKQKEIELLEQQRKITQQNSYNVKHLAKHTHAAEAPNPYKRRKVSTQSSWHLVLNPIKSTNEGKQDQVIFTKAGKSCSCGSIEVEMLENMSSRMTCASKADIWGCKRDQDDVSNTKYQCKSCGKIWNEID